MRAAKKLITHISVSADITSAPTTALSIADFLLNLIGIRTIGNFGKRYLIPHPKEFNWSIDKIHRLIISSLINYKDRNAPVFLDNHDSMREGKAYLRAQDSA